MGDAVGFVIIVYTLAVLAFGFWLGGRYKTLGEAKQRFLTWLAGLASKGPKP